ncbi:transglutaminase family protein [Amantichitinum ursilacus]|uniref:Transglutaminase-like domain-containing protein n=1 Tax=Amantichitinum ursilacus TaxID=857265 RepID=A0A0N0GKJ8_9NEIS|nr:transglutaminase family protein [Amantichitinum ursilacus]KPC49123.1 hypothetical protein WG78_21425 [Amantichitinum ursilacus]
MHLEIKHETVYRYDTPPAYSVQLLRLTPRADPGQAVVHWHLDVPGPTQSTIDTFGNREHVLTLEEATTEIRIVAHGIIETRPANPPHNALPPMVFRKVTPLTEPDEAIKAFAGKYRKLVARHGRHGLMDMMADLLDHMPYTPGETDVTTSARDAFRLSRGVCQDHSHVFLALCRFLEIPARYVSGYLYTENDHHVASHAWVDAFTDELWHGFDTSNGCTPDERYVRLAIGLDYLDACPIRGLRRGGGDEIMESHTRVRHAIERDSAQQQNQQ